MSQCLVPNWYNVRQQRQEDDDEEAPEEKKRSSHVNKLLPNPPMPMPSQQRVSELKWENGHLINTQELDQAPFLDQKASILLWPGTDDTLESVVHQASQYKRHIDSSDLGLDYYNIQHELPNNVMDSVVASSDIGGKWLPKPCCKCPADSDSTQKRPRQDPSPAQTRQYYRGYALHAGKPAKSSATASFESPQSFRTKTTDDDSACQGNPDDEVDDKTETVRSHSTRRSRAAAVHNQSERRRRDRINQKMKILQKLVPNASKTDKASVLDEVIEYMKQLQVQLQMMSSRTMSQMLMPMGMQHLQMPNIMARMGMGMGMGMLDSMAAPPPIPPLLHPTAAASPATFVPPPFMLPNLIPQLPQTQAKSVPHRHPMPQLSDPYSAYLAQAMNMELYSKMAAFYRQQAGDQMAKGTAASCKHSDSSV